MTKVIRVHSNNSDGKDRYEEFEVTPNREDIKFIEVLEVIPEHVKLLKTYRIAEE